MTTEIRYTELNGGMLVVETSTGPFYFDPLAKDLRKEVRDLVMVLSAEARRQATAGAPAEGLPRDAMMALLAKADTAVRVIPPRPAPGPQPSLALLDLEDLGL